MRVRRDHVFCLAAAIVWFGGAAPSPVEAKRLCASAMGTKGTWSWRLIDGRKCWYQGEDKLEKSELTWSHSSLHPPAAELSRPKPKPVDVMDAQARALDDPASVQTDENPTFDTRWRAWTKPSKP